MAEHKREEDHAIRGSTVQFKEGIVCWDPHIIEAAAQAEHGLPC